MNIKSEITFVIVSLESVNNLKKCIKNIGANYKIIIAENSNNSKIKDELESSFENVECILLGTNYGYATAANKGISCVKTKYAFLINADIEIYENQIIKIEKEINSLNKNFFIASPLYDDFKDFIENNRFDKVTNLNQKINLQNNYEKVNVLKGSSMLFNLINFKEKIFDEKFFFFFEEIDVCKKLFSAGKNIYLINSVKIEHSGNYGVENVNSNAMNKFRNWHYYWSSFYYHKKHYGYYVSTKVHITKLIKFFIFKYLYKIFNKNKSEMFKSRFGGLLNSMIGKKSSINKNYGGR